MASSESNTFEEESTHQLSTTTNLENMPLETSSSSAQIQSEFEFEKENENEKEIIQVENSNRPVVATQRSASYRGVRFSESAASDDLEQVDDSWWCEVENNDLLLDQVPNVTSVFTPTPEAILEKSISLEESESVLQEDNFDRLHKIADKIKMTLNEHAKNKEIEEKAERERKLSEKSSGDKENKIDFCETDCHVVAVAKEQSLEEFKEDLRSKRLQRQNAVQDLRDEIASLKRQLALEREVNRRLSRGEHVEVSLSPVESACASVNTSISEDNEDLSSRSRHANIELANAQLALQMANSENISLRGELAVVQKQVATLKEVIACCKQMLAVKEEQCNEIFR